MEDITLATNAELISRQEFLQKEFDETKLIVAEKMLYMEKLEKEYIEIDKILNKRLKK